MTEIKLNDKYYKDTLRGRKRQTIRKGRRDYPLGEAKFVFDNNDDIEIIITEITYKTLHNVTDQEARDDGFQSYRLLYKELEKYYPDITPKTEITLVKFY